MKNKLGFILKVENESAISSLNRFVHRYFDRTTTVWSDCARHNVMVFVTEGEATYSSPDSVCETPLYRKVTLLRRGEPFVVEFQPGCRVLTYSFDNYLPMDATVYMDLLSGIQSFDNNVVTFDIPKSLLVELVNVVQNIGSIKSNETLTHLAMRKVTAVMQRSLKPDQTAKLFAIRKSELGGEIFRYMKIAENRIKLTTKTTEVKF